MDWLINLVHQYGDIGLFLYCLIGPLTYMPIGPDVFLIAKALSCHCFPLTLVVSMVAAYTIAGTINYLIGRFLSRKLKIRSKWLRKVELYAEKYGFWGLLMVSAGPIPVREGCIAIGFLRLPFKKFVAAMVLGTGLRFGFEGLLGAYLI